MKSIMDSRKARIIFLAVLLCMALFAVIFFGFRLTSITYTSDLSQYTKNEVWNYLLNEDVDNTLVFWIRNLTGFGEEYDLFEDYKVTIKSPGQVSISAEEKKIQGYVKYNKVYYYLNSEGIVVKKSSEKMDGTFILKGLSVNSITLYSRLDVEDDGMLDDLLEAVTLLGKYGFTCKKARINEKGEITVFIKKLKLQLGTTTNLDEKIQAFNDIYDSAKKYKGTLNMKHYNIDGEYTLKTD